MSFPVSDRARDTRSDEIVALKKVRMDKEKDGASLFSNALVVYLSAGWNS